MRSGKDRKKFMGFLEQYLDLLVADDSGFFKKFQPENGLICFFDDNTEFCDEFRL